MTTEQKAFQDQTNDNHCYGCGKNNEKGLRIKSYWDGEESICAWTPQSHHTAGPPHVVNGGTIATIIDCHGIWTATAAAYKHEGREIGTGDSIWYATGSLHVNFLKPTPMGAEITLRANITEMTDRKTVMSCSLTANGEECANGEILVVRVPAEWQYPQ